MSSGEFDRIIVLFTSEFGKVNVLAKGAGRPGSRRAPYLEPLYYSRVLLDKGRDIDFVRGVQVIDDFMPLRMDMERLACALCAVELVDQFTAEFQHEQSIFNLLFHLFQPACGILADAFLQLCQPPFHIMEIRNYGAHFPGIQVIQHGGECAKCARTFIGDGRIGGTFKYQVIFN